MTFSLFLTCRSSSAIDRCSILSLPLCSSTSTSTKRARYSRRCSLCACARDWSFPSILIAKKIKYYLHARVVFPEIFLWKTIFTRRLEEKSKNDFLLKYCTGMEFAIINPFLWIKTKLDQLFPSNHIQGRMFFLSNSCLQVWRLVAVDSGLLFWMVWLSPIVLFSTAAAGFVHKVRKTKVMIFRATVFLRQGRVRRIRLLYSSRGPQKKGAKIVFFSFLRPLRQIRRKVCLGNTNYCVQ